MASSSNRQNIIEKIRLSLENDTVEDRQISEELEQSFLDYAKAVITSRALPDLRDGLKPVHRRIIYSAYQEKLMNDEKFKKSAALVGTVMGSYHPHGDVSIYDALVRMAQDFSLRYPLIQGQGNFGSIDGDSPAAMRYTEAKLSKLGEYFLHGIEENSVNFVDNYDQSKLEPEVLPTLIPNILINGSTGIAVGLATNIPPHNLTEVINATISLTKKANWNSEKNDWDYVDFDDAEIYEHIAGPDFPTCGEIFRYSGVQDYFSKGKGTFLIRSKIDVETAPNKRVLLIIREIPYGIKKVKIIERIVSLIKPNKGGEAQVPVLADSIVDIRDESNLEGIRVVIECRVGVPAEVIINNLYKYTQLQTSYSPNLTLLVDGKPIKYSLVAILQMYFSHQTEMLKRRMEFQRVKLEQRLHILEGRLKIVDDIVEAVKLINTSDNPDEDIKQKYSLSEEQKDDIMKFQIGRLKKMSIKKLKEEQEQKRIERDIKVEILNSPERQKEEFTNSLIEIRDKFGDERRTRVNKEVSGIIRYIDLFHFTDSVFFLTKEGYINQIPLEEFKLHKRGGVGVKGADMYKDNTPMMMISCNGKDDLFFFTNKGRVYRKKAYEMNLGSGKSNKGKKMSNVLSMSKGEEVITMLSLTQNDYRKGVYLFFATKNGLIKKTPIENFQRVNANGKIAIVLKEKDMLKFVIRIDDDSEILLASSANKAVRFSSKFISGKDSATGKPEGLRPTSRSSMGRIGINLDNGVELVSTSSTYDGSLAFSISEKGIGKLTNVDEFRMSNIGKKVGVIAQKSTESTGKLLACVIVKETDEILLMTNTNKVNRFKVKDVSESSRNTKGVKLFTLAENERIIYYAKNPEGESEEETTGDN